MLLAIGLLVVGFVILGVGAETMVRGSSTIALKLGITPLVIGLTVVAFGTSAPELAVSVESALTGRSSIALGNVIGSNIANIGLILGIIAVISPIKIERELIVRQIPLLIGVSIFMWLLLLDGVLGTIDGLLLVSGLIAFLLYSYRSAGSGESTEALLISSPILSAPTKPILYYIAMVIVGLVMLVYGSTVFVESAVTLARILGLSEAVIGLSIVAVGTSLPELATSLVAAWKKESGLAVGNVVGSNLFNILAILGITALIQSIYGQDFDWIDFSVMLAFAVILIPMSFRTLTISRLSGVVLLSGYCAYMVFILYTN